MMEQIRNNKTLKLMMLGILIWGILWQVACMFTKRILFHSVGLWVGIAAALIMAVNMALTLDTAMELGERGAVSHMRKYLIIRYSIACISIIILGITGWADVVTCFAGILGLKISAYTEPLLSRIIFGKEETSGDETEETDDTVEEPLTDNSNNE